MYTKRRVLTIKSHSSPMTRSTAPAETIFLVGHVKDCVNLTCASFGTYLHPEYNLSDKDRMYTQMVQHEVVLSMEALSKA
jgi:hypothetical protein